ncbi:MAG: type II toxin-antitoxin system HicA family toxin [Gemmataceae bacterium]|nr:type II toxin-antitoxin system HicA family toxin [Gemmataceae bacterium]
MKRTALLKHLRRHGCSLKREGGSHSLWTNPRTGHTEAVPRHTEVPDILARKICRNLSVPDPGIFTVGSTPAFVFTISMGQKVWPAASAPARSASSASKAREPRTSRRRGSSG